MRRPLSIGPRNTFYLIGFPTKFRSDTANRLHDSDQVVAVKLAREALQARLIF